MKALLKLLAILAVLATRVAASEPVSIGHTFSLTSEVLGHERRVHIHLPEGYASDTKQRYPVIYSVGETRGFKAHAGLLDSFSHYRPIMPPVIYVVLATVPEGGDQIPVFEMTPKTKADRILTFFEMELIPYIDNKYRTQPYRILDGGHLTAVFCLYTLMTRTELFQAYIATTPYLFRDDSALIHMASDFFDKERDLSAFLYLSINDGRLRPYYDRFINILEQQAPPTLDWHSVEYPEGRRQPPVLAWIDALYRLFADQRLSDESVEFGAGAESIYSYYQDLSEDKYGYEISAADALNELGSLHLERNETDKAIKVFAFSVGKYPNSAMLYDSLAAAFERAGRLGKAVESQEMAVQNARAGLNYDDIHGVELYEARLEELRAKKQN